MEELEKEKLYIPQGLKTKTDFFNGFGKEELFQAILASVVAGAIETIVYMFTKSTTFCVVFILSAIAGSVMMLTKDKTNVSVVDQLRFMVKFAKSQKKYKYLDEWK